jgi:hypothetical protein
MPLPAINTRIVSGVCQKNFIQVAENQSKNNYGYGTESGNE